MEQITKTEQKSVEFEVCTKGELNAFKDSFKALNKVVNEAVFNIHNGELSILDYVC